MQVTCHSFGKINLGLCIGPLRPDGFHQLCTVYQTIAMHDLIHLEIERGSGIEIRCTDRRVPTDHTNICYKIAARAMTALRTRGRLLITIEKRLPVRGGLGGASGNAVATLLALERALKKPLPRHEKLRIAAEVGSDLPLFLMGGTVLGVGHGEEVYPLPDLPSIPCVVAIPDIGVSTPKAFADWDTHLANLTQRCHSEPALAGKEPAAKDQTKADSSTHKSTLGITKSLSSPTWTQPTPSDRIRGFSRALGAWLISQSKVGEVLSGVFAKGGGRAGNPLLDLVRTGIENDFEQVVFPQYPELSEVKSVLLRAGAFYASLSGSGSAIYGLFRSRAAAQRATASLRKEGISAPVTSTLTRRQYWQKIWD
jgi:4-diphosphocytidyl-2-C-methyl-D-erythritol kinase